MTVEPAKPIHHPTQEWLKENSKFFLPPVCNKMMHNDQLKVFFVGGPNQRKDFHLEEGEELFYMRKGNMELPILTEGAIRTVKIKEGQVFLLPGRIPHSPQREAETVGLVIERDRMEEENDGLRYFIDGTTDILFERWFKCVDLGSQLKPIIDEYFASDEHRTQTPKSDSVLANPPWQPDSRRRVEEPFDLQDWLDKNRRLIRSRGEVHLFDPAIYQSDVKVLGHGNGKTEFQTESEVFLWQLEGSTTITVNGIETRLRRDDTLLIGGEKEVEYAPTMDAMTLFCQMSPKNKSRPTV